MMRVRTAVCLVGIATVVAVTEATVRDTLAQIPWPSHRISVSVSCDDEYLRNSITRYLRSELRLIPDVELVDSEPDYSLSIVAEKVSTMGGEEIGFVYALLITYGGIDRSVEAVASFNLNDCAGCDEQVRRFIYEYVPKLTAGTVRVLDHRLSLGSSVKSLQELISNDVSVFDNEILEDHRELLRSINPGIR